MVRRTLLLSALAVAALPGAAVAATPAITTTSAAVSPAGATTIKVSNPTRQALRGTASVAAGGATVATKAVALRRRSVTTVSLRLSARAVAALRAAGGRATVRLALRRAGGRRATARRTVRFALPAATPAPGTVPAPGTPGGPAPATPAPAPQPTPAPAPEPQPAPIPAHWIAQVGPDRVKADVTDGQLQFTDLAWIPVTCTEDTGGSYTARERFVARGPWAIGTDAERLMWSVAINRLVGGAERVMSFRVTGSSVTATRLAGTLHMAFSDRRANTWGGYTDVECAGSLAFEGVPAP